LKIDATEVAFEASLLRIASMHEAADIWVMLGVGEWGSEGGWLGEFWSL